MRRRKRCFVFSLYGCLALLYSEEEWHKKRDCILVTKEKKNIPSCLTNSCAVSLLRRKETQNLLMIPMENLFLLRSRICDLGSSVVTMEGAQVTGVSGPGYCSASARWLDLLKH